MPLSFAVNCSELHDDIEYNDFYATDVGQLQQQQETINIATEANEFPTRFTLKPPNKLFDVGFYLFIRLLDFM